MSKRTSSCISKSTGKGKASTRDGPESQRIYQPVARPPICLVSRLRSVGADRGVGRGGSSSAASNGDQFADDQGDIGEYIDKGNRHVVRPRSIHGGRGGSSSGYGNGDQSIFGRSATGEGGRIADDYVEDLDEGMVELDMESSQRRRGSNIADTPPTKSSQRSWIYPYQNGECRLEAARRANEAGILIGVEYRCMEKKSKAGRENRSTLVEGQVSKHVAGPIRINQHRLRMEKEIGGPVSSLEVYQRCHTKRGSVSEYITTRAKNVADKYSDLMEEKYGAYHECHPSVGDREIWERSCGRPCKKGRFFRFSAPMNLDLALTDKHSIDFSDDEGSAYFGEALMVVGNNEMTELVMDSGDNRTCTIKGIGKVKIQLHDGSSFILEDVRYVPGLRRSLILLGTLKKEGYTVKMEMSIIKVDKCVWFKVKLNGAQRNREAKVFQVGANILITGVPVQDDAEGNVAEKKKMKEFMRANLRKLLKYKAWSTRWSAVRGYENVIQVVSPIHQLLMMTYNSSRDLCDKNCHQLCRFIAEKMQKEKEQQDKLKAVKARPLYGNESGRNPRNHKESHYSESKTPTARTEPRRRYGRKHSRSPSRVASVFRRLKQNRSPSPRLWPRKEGGVFDRLGRKEPGAYTRSDSHRQSSQAKGTEVPARKHHHEGTSSRRTSGYSESEDSERGHWKSKSKRHRSNTYEDDLSQPWTCEERNPFTTRIRHFDFPRTRMPSHVKIYDGSGDPEDHIKLFQSAAKTERWAMPTWCHMFNSTLTGNARVCKQNTLRIQWRYITSSKRDGESTEDFMERYKEEVLDVEGAPECMKISGFMHGITHPDLIKRLYEKIPRSMDEMYRVTTSFLQGEVAAFSHGRKKAPTP
ncbi:reverse transcriptase domain-containing protein [Tanacetum coccineum]